MRSEHGSVQSVKRNRKSVKIPDRFRKYFWDCVFDKLTFYEYDIFITERLLNFGNMDSVKWLLSRIDRERLRDVVETSRNLTKKTRNYWKTILDESNVTS